MIVSCSVYGFGFGIWYNVLGGKRIVTVAIGPFTIFLRRK